MSWPKLDIRLRLPRQVRGVEYNNPILVLFGEDWYLKLACPWSGAISGVPVDWESPAVEDHAWGMIGSKLVAVEEGDRPVDVTFTFDDAILAARPDTDEDSWVLSFADFVAVGGLD